MNSKDLLERAREIVARPFVPLSYDEQVTLITAFNRVAGVPGSERVLDIALEGLDELECGINHIRGELVHPDAPLDPPTELEKAEGDHETRLQELEAWRNEWR